MARPLRIEFPGAFYHITSRGNSRHKIYFSKKDYFSFLSIFKDCIDRYNWKCYAYCLMPNHYHLLIKTVDPNLSQGMRQLNGVYTQKINYFHKRVGHLLQSRYKAILVDEEDYFFELIRYIHLNPARAQIVKNIDCYFWSSHREIISRSKETVCCKNEILEKFGGLKEYKKHISQKLEKNDNLWDELKGGVVLGSAEFIEVIRNYIKKEDHSSRDVKKIERYVGRPSLPTIFRDNYSNINERNKLIFKAYKEYGYTLSDIGREVDLHNSFVGKIVKKMIKDKS